MVEARPVRLRYTLLALADLEAILDYISDRSPLGAQRIQARLRDVLELLSQYPKIGVPADDARIRRLTIAPYPYLIFYEISDDEIVIHAIRHGARDPLDNPGLP